MPYVLVAVPIALGYAVGQWTGSIWLGVMAWFLATVVLLRLQVSVFRQQRDDQDPPAKTDVSGLHRELAALQTSPAMMLAAVQRRDEILRALHELGARVDNELVRQLHDQHHAAEGDGGLMAIWTQEGWDQLQAKLTSN